MKNSIFKDYFQVIKIISNFQKIIFFYFFLFYPRAFLFFIMAIVNYRFYSIKFLKKVDVRWD